MMFFLEPCTVADLERLPHRFEHTLQLRCTPERAFAAITRIETEAEWFPDFVAARWLTKEPQGVGSVRDYQLSYLRLLEEFLVWEAPHRLVFCMSQTSMPIVSRMMEEYRITPLDDSGCRLEWCVAYEPQPALRWAHSTIRPYFARVFAEAADRLTKFCNGPDSAQEDTHPDRRRLPRGSWLGRLAPTTQR